MKTKITPLVILASAVVLATNTLFVTHRGDMIVEKENTLAAIKRAKLLGADGCELDVRLAKDGTVVMAHDAVKEGDESFEKACEFMGKNGMFCILDVKDSRAAKKSVDIMKRHGILDKSLTIVYSAESAKQMKTLAPEISPFLLMHKKKDESVDAYFNRLDEALKFAGTDGAFLSTWSTSYVAALHKKGYRVMYGSFTNCGQIASPLKAGADYIIVDNPEFVKKAKEKSAISTHK